MTSLRLRHKESGTEAWFAGWNPHSVSPIEFIAQFDGGDASSEFKCDWEPVDSEWPEIE